MAPENRRRGPLTCLAATSTAAAATLQGATGLVPAATGHDGLFSGLWGWMQVLCFWLLDLLQWLARLTGNWGVAIIVLAVLVRAATYPFARRAMHEQMRFNDLQSKLAPTLRQIKQDYRGGEQSERIIDLYQAHNVSPAAGLKPLLIVLLQLPIFIALFQILRLAPELHGMGFLWIGDLSVPDQLMPLGVSLPWFGAYLNLLPVLLVATILLATATAPGELDRAASRKRWWASAAMAAMFFALFYRFPAGLVLYWVATNLLHVLQQLLTTMGRKPPRLPDAPR